jgi:hypothetical protein
MPRDSKLYIPETSYVEGTLIGGISVSTSVGSSSEPVPVVIRVTGKGSLPVFEWWRPQRFWTEHREQALLEWVHFHSFVSAHTDLSDWEAWCEATQRILPLHEKGAVYGPFPLNGLCAA